MNTHYFHPALKALRRNPLLAVVVVYSIGFGVASLIAFLAMRRETSERPMPHRSGQLYVVRLSAAPQSVFGSREFGEGDRDDRPVGLC